MTEENRTSRGMLLIGVFAAGAVAGWLAHAKSQADSVDSAQPWGAPGDTVYPPHDSPDEGDESVPPVTDADVHGGRAGAVPNVDDEIDPEIAAASSHDVKHGTSVADQPYAADPITRAH